MDIIDYIFFIAIVILTSSCDTFKQMSDANALLYIIRSVFGIFIALQAVRAFHIVCMHYCEPKIIATGYIGCNQIYICAFNNACQQCERREARDRKRAAISFFVRNKIYNTMNQIFAFIISQIITIVQRLNI